MTTILKAENISKQYRLGNVGTGTIKDDLKRNWYALRGKEDPFLKVGAVNERAATASEDYVWALKDINFEVTQGEVLGIIGKNGAGKSTLLKILSRVTAPTTGVIKTKGRIASLLEVGTGFHPELTGRENIYLNGAILGMSKTEITSKIDEIIAFSGCERYIDTPTKRYSSGMTVRLAFAVAAHLEPEILVVDEVLAVGDAAFQKKAIGKMQEISQGQGRTVLFVSHDMSAVKRLCERVILLEDGTIKEIGKTDDIVKKYLTNEHKDLKISSYPENESDKTIKLESAHIVCENQGIIDAKEDFKLKFTINIEEKIKFPLLTFHIKNSVDDFVLLSDIRDSRDSTIPYDEGTYNFEVAIDQPLLVPDHYFISVGLTNKDNGQTNHFTNILNFEVVDLDNVRSQRAGYIYKELSWDIKQ